MATRPSHTRRPTEEALLPTTRPQQGRSSSDTSGPGSFLKVDPYAQSSTKALPDPPLSSSRPPSYKPRQSLGRLSTMLRQQLGSSHLRPSSKVDRPLSPTRSPSHKPMRVSSPLVRNPPWTFATLSHIHAQGPAPHPQPSAPTDDDSGEQTSRPRFLPPAPSSGSHVAEAYARVRERAQLGSGSTPPLKEAEAQESPPVLHAAVADESQSVRSESLIDLYYTMKE